MFKVYADVVYTFMEEEVASNFAKKYSVLFNTTVVINYPDNTHITFKSGVKTFK